MIFCRSVAGRQGLALVATHWPYVPLEQQPEAPDGAAEFALKTWI